MENSSSIQLKAILLYLLFVFGSTWGLVFAYAHYEQSTGSTAWSVLLSFVMLCPALSALLALHLTDQRPILPAAGLILKSNRWILLAIALPVVLTLLSLVPSVYLTPAHLTADPQTSINGIATTVHTSAGSPKHTPSGIHPAWIVLGFALIFGPTFEGFFFLGSEIGWRGFLQPALRPLGFWRAALLTGAIWGLWYAPLISQGYLYPHAPRQGILIMAGLSVLLSPILGFLRLKSETVIAPAVFQGTLTAVSTLPFWLLAGAPRHEIGIAGIAGLWVLLALNIVLYVLTRNDPALR